MIAPQVHPADLCVAAHRTRHATACTALGSLSLVLLAACGGQTSSHDVATTEAHAGELATVQSSGATPPAPPSPAPMPAQPPPAVDGHTDEDGEFASPEPVPAADANSDALAVVAAESVTRVFVRRTVDAEAWWRELRSLLTPAAQAAYEGTDPLNVPASAVTGPAALAASPSAFLARVSVPTDVGAYLVLLVRTGAGAPWLVERLTPPETAGS